MAISETASLEPTETKSQKELNYLELKDKVVDITKDTKVGLNTLKSELKLNTETELDAALAQLNLNVDKLVS